MREPLRLVCELVGACVLAGMGLSLVWFGVALVVSSVRDLMDRRRRAFVPRAWVEQEQRRGDHPSSRRGGGRDV